MIYFSVIIPVYNSQRYIGKCITSIVNQTFNDYETLIIDDGSDDNSSIIINKIIANDNRFHYYYQTNQGVGAARNAGLQKAKGKYIIFVDSDDYIDINSFATFYSFIQKFNPDVLICGTKQIENNTVIDNYSRLSDYFIPNTLYYGKDVYNIMMENKSFVPMACNNVYKYEVIDRYNILFQNIIYEDALWVLNLLFHNPRVLIVNFDFYYYRRHKRSITRSSSFDKIYYSVLFIITKLRVSLNSNIDTVFYGWLIVHVYTWYLHLWKSLNSMNLYAIDWPKIYNFEKMNFNIEYLNNSQFEQFNYLVERIKWEIESNNKRFLLSEKFKFYTFNFNKYIVSNVYILNKNLDINIISVYADYFEKIVFIFKSSVYVISTTNNIEQFKKEVVSKNITFFDLNNLSLTSIMNDINTSKCFSLIIHHEIFIYSLSVLQIAFDYIYSNPNSIAILDLGNMLKIKHSKFSELINSQDESLLLRYINCNYLRFRYNPYVYNSFVVCKKDFNKAFLYICNAANMYTCRHGINLLFDRYKVFKSEVALFMNIIHKKFYSSNVLEKLYMSHPEFNVLKNNIYQLTLLYNNKKYVFYEGLMGYAFSLVIYSKYFDTINYLKIANEIIEKYINLIRISPTVEVLNNLIMVSQSLNYLQYKSLIEVSPNFLNLIDDYFCNYIIKGVYNDYSFEYGLSGMATYLIYRMNNFEVRLTHRKKIMMALHIFINRLYDDFYDTTKDLLPPKRINIDLYICLMLNNIKGVNKNKSLKLSSFILANTPDLMNDISVYQNIRLSNQINNIQNIINISILQRSTVITGNNFSLKGGLLEQYLWKISEIFEYDIDWWCIY